MFDMGIGVSLLLFLPDYLQTNFFFGQVFDLLVLISLKYYYSYTLSLSTSFSSRGLMEISSRGGLRA